MRERQGRKKVVGVREGGGGEEDDRVGRHEMHQDSVLPVVVRWSFFLSLEWSCVHLFSASHVLCSCCHSTGDAGG